MKTSAILLVLTLYLLPSNSPQGKDTYLPNHSLTPGDTVRVSRVDLCSPDYKSPATNIPIALKVQVFDAYGVSPNALGFNVDHLIPVGLGGSNSLKNLWPQPLAGEWNYHMKNDLEEKLQKLVCSGQLDLETAQREIAADWVGAYEKYMKRRQKGGTPPPNDL